MLKLIYLDDIVYEGWIGSWFTNVHKIIFVNTESCTGISEQYIWIELID